MQTFHVTATSVLWILIAASCAAGADDANIVFREDFENFDRKAWDEIRDQAGAIEIVAGGHDGRKCVQITHKLNENEGGHLYKLLRAGLDVCHLRFYVKFEKDHGYVHHFVHMCAYNPPTRWPQGGAGERPKGNERFTSGIEPWGFWGKHPAPGAWNLYSYWQEMKGSRDGRFWGNSFAPEKPALIPTDKWICVELMMKANSAPDKADGEQAFWIDGKEIGRWGGIRWRSSKDLKINGIWMLYYITETAWRQNKSEPRKTSRIWFDDIVVSKSYVGPSEVRKEAP